MEVLCIEAQCIEILCIEVICIEFSKVLCMKVLDVLCIEVMYICIRGIKMYQEVLKVLYVSISIRGDKGILGSNKY